MSREKEAAGRLLPPPAGLAGWAGGAGLPTNWPLPAQIELGPQCILDCIGVLKREIAICLCERRQLAPAGLSVNQTLNGHLGGDGHERLPHLLPLGRHTIARVLADGLMCP